MPGGDGTGPAGMGPMTGRAAGYCAGYGVAGVFTSGYGRGFWGRGRGGGRGYRNQFYATSLTGRQRCFGGPPMWYNPGAPDAPFYNPPVQTMTGAQELETLKDQAAYLEETLSNLLKRIEELEKKGNSSQ